MLESVAEHGRGQGARGLREGSKGDPLDLPLLWRDQLGGAPVHQPTDAPWHLKGSPWQLLDLPF